MYIKQRKHKYFVLWLCLKISFPKLKAINVYLLKTKFVSVGIIKKGILNKKKKNYKLYQKKDHFYQIIKQKVLNHF